MLYNLVQDDKFLAMMQAHIVEMLSYLFDKEQPFGILCKIDQLHFEPELPEEIYNEFHPMTLFFLAGYTFESAQIIGNTLQFEAGFGTDNIGSVVTVPLLNIMQIIIDETPIHVNLASEIVLQDDAHETQGQEDSGVEKSMAAFLNNPENDRFKK